MSVANITPPTVLASITYTSGKDGAGVPLQYAQHTSAYRASEAVLQGQAVSFIAPTATAPLSVALSNTGNALDEELIAGIALHDAAAGDLLSIGDVAYARLADGTTTTRGEACPLSATDGILAEGVAAATTNDITHPFLVLQDSIADFWGTAVDGVLVKLRVA